MPDFAATCTMMAETRKIFAATCTILALTWFCHLSMCLWSLGGGLRSPKGGPPSYTWKKLQCLKMIFRPFGAKKNKKNWIWKMHPADPPPPPLIWNFPWFILFFFEPFPYILHNFEVKILGTIGWKLKHVEAMSILRTFISILTKACLYYTYIMNMFWIFIKFLSRIGKLHIWWAGDKDEV